MFSIAALSALVTPLISPLIDLVKNKTTKQDTMVYTALAKINVELLKARRRIQWQVTLVYLLSMGIITFALLKIYQFDHIKLPYYCIIVAGFAIAEVIYAFWFLPAIEGSNRKDLDQIIRYRKLAEGEHVEKLHDLGMSPREYAFKNKAYLYSIAPQIIISFIVFVISSVLLLRIIP